MKLIFSKPFKERLIKMDNPIARQILYKEGDYHHEVSYLGISQTNPNYISYLTQDRFDRLKKNQYWHIKKRFHSKPGRVLAKIMTSTLNSEIEKFSLDFIQQSNRTTDVFKIVFGEEIRKMYLEDNYFSIIGSLGESCMRYAETQGYLDIYCENPNKIGLAVLLDKETSLVKARCMIWYPNGIKDKSLAYFDRIYSTNTVVELEMYKRCKRRKFIQISEKNQIKPAEVPNIRIYLDNIEFDNYPYVDTLYYLDRYDSNLNNRGDGVAIQETDGTTADTQRECDICGRSEDAEDLGTIDRGSRVGCQACSSCREWSDYYNGYIASEDAYYCDFTHDYYLDSDIAELYGSSKVCYIEYDKLMTSEEGHYFIEGDYRFIEPVDREGEYYLIDNLTEINNKYYHPDDTQLIEDVLSETESQHTQD